MKNITAYVDFLRRNTANSASVPEQPMSAVAGSFHNPEAWRQLEFHAISPLIESKAEGEPIRAWTVGCTSGLEAYLLAMLLIKNARQSCKHCPVQVFATDVNAEVLQAARIGHYPAHIAKHIPADLLNRFFLAKNAEGLYSVGVEPREVVVFGMHDPASPPPFSRLDVIACRNPPVDADADAENKTLFPFHSALRVGGYLFLDSATAVGPWVDGFKPVAKCWPIYRQAVAPASPDKDQCVRLDMSEPHGGRDAERKYREIQLAQQKLLDLFTPAAVLVNRQYEVLYFCGRTEKFLLHPRGAPSRDLLALVRDGLRARLRESIGEALVSGADVVAGGLQVKRDGVYVPVKLTVMPIADASLAERLLLVVFEDQAVPSWALPGIAEDQDPLRRQFEDELRVARADLGSQAERLQNADEELRIARRELAAANEQLQFSAWQVESSRLELQSLNEALGKLNRQLREKAAELDTAGNDLQNLLACSRIASLRLDLEFRIRWLTPEISSILNLIPADLGRPFCDVAEEPAAAGLLSDAEAVLQSLVPSQHEFQTANQHWYIRRLLPYVNKDGAVEGVIVTFTDITECKRISEMAMDAKDVLTGTLEQRVQERTRQLRTLALELTFAEERERRKLAQDLHDDMCQILAAAQIKLAGVDKHERRGNLKLTLGEINELVDRANRSVRTLVFQLSPPILYEHGLPAAIKWLADEMRKHYGLSVAIRGSAEINPPDETARTVLFRAVRELLINAAKHAGVCCAEVGFLQKGPLLEITVMDKGHGFDSEAAAAKAGFGLASIRERLGFIGGDMNIVSNPGAGTVIALTAPLNLETPSSAKPS